MKSADCNANKRLSRGNSPNSPRSAKGSSSQAAFRLEAPYFARESLPGKR
jgi:hypothetical protein